MPRNATAAKPEATEGYGAQVTLCEPTLRARETTAARVQAETGATSCSPAATSISTACRGGTRADYGCSGVSSRDTELMQ